MQKFVDVECGKSHRMLTVRAYAGKWISSFHLLRIEVDRAGSSTLRYRPSNIPVQNGKHTEHQVHPYTSHSIQQSHF
jgi:hypothetical protein